MQFAFKELFIDHLANAAYNSTKGNKNVQYKHLAEVVHKQRNMEFLRGIHRLINFNVQLKMCNSDSNGLLFI